MSICLFENFYTRLEAEYQETLQLEDRASYGFLALILMDMWNAEVPP
jgi:hypothetical protein